MIWNEMGLFKTNRNVLLKLVEKKHKP